MPEGVGYEYQSLVGFDVSCKDDLVCAEKKNWLYE